MGRTHTWCDPGHKFDAVVSSNRQATLTTSPAPHGWKGSGERILTSALKVRRDCTEMSYMPAEPRRAQSAASGRIAESCPRPHTTTLSHAPGRSGGPTVFGRYTTGLG